ncbi:hypothetical protein FKM82_006399 [Ascaphus truei]
MCQQGILVFFQMVLILSNYLTVMTSCLKEIQALVEWLTFQVNPQLICHVKNKIPLLQSIVTGGHHGNTEALQPTYFCVGAV